MDLSNLTISQDAITFDLTHPETGEVLTTDDGKKSFTWSVYGVDSKKYAESVSAVKRKARKNKKSDDVDIEETWKASSDLLAELTSSFHVVMDGKIVAPNKANAFQILSDYRFKWLREQVEQKVFDRSGFMKG